MNTSDTIVEILECPKGHGNKAISVNGFRLVGKKCCGQWKTIKKWEVPRATLEQDLTRALEINYSEDIDETPKLAVSGQPLTITG